ncbi:MAG: NAD-glutamate dehydrogenase [Actinomycetota bacterium]|nr:NAD-glutamate dehydrogenase [Actinomycetota bacterium]
MAVKAADESELIETVCERIRERLPDHRASACESFVRQYYHWVPPEDLATRGARDLYGAAIAHWNLVQQRGRTEPKVRVYNPDRDRDGWESPHTVIEIVTTDMPFIVDSVTMELGRQGHSIDLVIHPVLRIRRDVEGRLLEVLDPGANAEDAISESVLHAEVVREPDQGRLDQLEEGLRRVLMEVRSAVEDWPAMRDRTRQVAGELSAETVPVDSSEIEEAKAFLTWLAADSFTFLGYREYDFIQEDGEAGLRVVPDSGLGILRGNPARTYTKLREKAVEMATAPHVLVLTKANSRATVHRPSYLDYIGVRKFDADGRVIGERRFLGLYSTSAYRASPRNIPILRGRVEGVLKRSGFPRDSHDAKGLIDLLESYPRDALLQLETEQLYEIAIGMLGLGERQRVRLFVWPDPLDRFISCLVTIPRDRFNTENRERVGRVLLEAYDGTHLEWTLQLSESLLARVYFVIHCPDGVPPDVDVGEVQERLVTVTRAWNDDLRTALIEEFGEQRGASLCRRYERAFPPAYRSDWSARAAVSDITAIEALAGRDAPIISLYRPQQAEAGVVRCKLYSSRGISLSDVLPTFEHMGANVVDERPHEVAPSGRDPVWIYDFGLRGSGRDLMAVRELFQEAFLEVWRGELEDDGLNGLVVRAGLSARTVGIIRAIAKYLRQAGLPYSGSYVVRTLLGHSDIASMLVKLFFARLHPDEHDAERSERLAGEITEAIDAVESLDEDRILRSFLSVVQAILRTNYFSRGARSGEGGAGGQDLGRRPYLSIKLDPARIPVLPQPRPLFEIFVYSPRVEGVHLRGGRVARGGLRWSDRPEDFRTEVLGLMKAQMVKNALIVPVGSKGGFVVKRPPSDGGREALLAEGIACYETFLSGLLDLTDNIVEDRVVPPDRVVRYDDDDPYLVVAADKGTATFSDIANDVSARYGFWLGDAFASGGSNGYDHKQMGITARGAWESVKRHFRELGTDIQSTEITVVGIGDMSGDVFGNGMLLSRHLKLLAAFNHMHIFLDPDPDPDASFAERRRLFEMSRSAWSDYDKSLISRGGGIFSRASKSIAISPEAKEAFGLDADELSPSDLIRELLRAPVDLFWNGGIGTYVKASTETHADAGDKSNDAVRVDGHELRCKVVGEGGNLGFTQRGRVDYALRGGPDRKGGRISTDAIDNVAGVNTSDHEVNLKILLDSLVRGGTISVDRRNELLQEMTDAVGAKVLYGSYTQTQALSLAVAQAAPMVDVHGRLIRYLEQVAGLKRRLEALPDEDTIADRKAAHQGLVAPELAVVMAYCKIDLYSELLDSDLPEDPYLAEDLERYFPPPLPERYSAEMGQHRLRREIVATVVANQLVDRAGTSFAFRVREETGAPPSLLARAYAVARGVFEMRAFWSAIEALDNQVDAGIQLDMLIEGRRLVERATRWLVAANPHQIDISRSIAHFRGVAKMLAGALPAILDEEERELFDEPANRLREAGVPTELAEQVAGIPWMDAAFDIVQAAERTGREPRVVMEVYFLLGSRIELDHLHDRITELPRSNRWQELARAALREELTGLHRRLTEEVLETGAPAGSEAAIEAWWQRNPEAVERCLSVLGDIKAAGVYDTTTISVALREVRNLIRSGAEVPADARAEDPVT